MTNKSIHYSVMLSYISCFGIPFSLLISILLTTLGQTNRNLERVFLDDKKKIFIQVFCSILSASSGILSSVFWNYAIKYENASRASILRSLDIFFVFLQQYLLLGIESNGLSILGAMLILSGSLFIISFKIIDEKYSSSEINNDPSQNKTERQNLLKTILFHKI